MASETKVGLLAGLAFIICFAVILANRGRQETISPHMLQLVEDDRGVPQSPERKSPRFLPASTVSEAIRDGSARPSNPPRSERSESARVERHADGPISSAPPDAAAVKPPARNLRQTPQHVPYASRSDVPLEPLTAPATADATWSSSQQVPEAFGKRAALEKRLDELSATLALQTHSNTNLPAEKDEAGVNERAAGVTTAPGPGHPRGLKPAPRRSPVAVQVRYKVLPGDTLSKIASTHYRSRSRAVINSIFDANRSLLASPDEIQVGMELILPKIKEVAALPAATLPRNSKTTERAAGFNLRGSAEGERESKSPARSDDRFRWYQIRKDDRYVSIAREQLGDESRWQEIYELNKGKFPDPGRIREGVRIKLPRTQAAASGKGRS